MTSLVSTLKGDKVAIDVDAVRHDSVSADVAARFNVHNLLGEGGMGSVFVAQLSRGVRHGLGSRACHREPDRRQAYLVTEDGKVAVSEQLEQAMLATVKDPDEPLQLPAVDDAEVARRIAGSERGGTVVTGDRLFVFSKLMSLPWTYVVELDRARYDL